MVNAIQILQCHPATKSPGYLRHLEAQMICHCHRLVSSHSINFIMIWIWGITSKCTSTHWPTVAIPTGAGMLCASHTEWSRHSHTYSVTHTCTQTHTHTLCAQAPPRHARIPTHTHTHVQVRCNFRGQFNNGIHLLSHSIWETYVRLELLNVSPPSMLRKDSSVSSLTLQTSLPWRAFILVMGWL